MKAHLMGPIGGFSGTRILTTDSATIQVMEVVDRDGRPLPAGSSWSEDQDLTVAIATFVRTRKVDEHGCTVFVRS